MTKVYSNADNVKCNLLMDKNKKNKKLQEYRSSRPTIIYDKMFSNPSTWMGYADFDSKDYLKLNN